MQLSLPFSTEVTDNFLATIHVCAQWLQHFEHQNQSYYNTSYEKKRIKDKKVLCHTVASLGSNLASQHSTDAILNGHIQHMAL